MLEGTFRDARTINPIGGFPENEMTGAVHEQFFADPQCPKGDFC